MFNSEAIWMGGLPWTYHVSNSGIIQRDEQYVNCDDRDEQVSGWRYCVDDEPNPINSLLLLSSWSWDAHTGITRYYSKDNLDFPQNVLSAQRGDLVAVFDLYGADRRFSTSALCDANLFNGIPVPTGTNSMPQCDAQQIDVGTNGFPGLDNDATRNVFYNQIILDPQLLNNSTEDGVGSTRSVPGLNINEQVSGSLNQSIRVGDYVTVTSGGGHGFLVAGWGPIVSCQRALGQDAQYSNILWLFSGDLESETQATNAGYMPLPLFPTSGEAQLYNSGDDAFNYSYIVPYVVDFPGSIDRPENAPAQLQRPRPRPFYCSSYPDPDWFGINSQLDEGFWVFYTVLDGDVVQLSSDNIYVPQENWEWNEDE